MIAVGLLDGKAFQERNIVWNEMILHCKHQILNGPRKIFEYLFKSLNFTCRKPLRVK